MFVAGQVHLARVGVPGHPAAAFRVGLGNELDPSEFVPGITIVVSAHGRAAVTQGRFGTHGRFTVVFRVNVLDAETAQAEREREFICVALAQEQRAVVRRVAQAAGTDFEDEEAAVIRVELQRVPTAAADAPDAAGLLGSGSYRLDHAGAAVAVDHDYLPAA